MGVGAVFAWLSMIRMRRRNLRTDGLAALLESIAFLTGQRVDCCCSGALHHSTQKSIAFLTVIHHETGVQ